MYIGPHGRSVLCSWMIFIDEYFLPPLVIGQIIDSIDRGPWESTKRRVFIARSFPRINTDYYSEGSGCCSRGQLQGGCLHFNLAFICVLSSKDSCHKAESPVSGLCLDKVNK